MVQIITYTVQGAVTQTRDTMKLETQSPTVSTRFAMMPRLSRRFSPCKTKSLSTIQLHLKIKHDLTLWQIDSGVQDVKIFNPHDKTSRKLQKDAKRYHEKLKKPNISKVFRSRSAEFLPTDFWMHRWRCSNSHAEDAAISGKTK